MQKNVCEYWRKDIHNEVIRREVAISDEDDIFFGELFDLADRVSTYLISCINQAGPIAVFLPKGKFVIAADMGILQSGNAYNNLDVQSPKERISGIVSHIRPKAIITDHEHETKICHVHGGGIEVHVICIEDIADIEIDDKKIEDRISAIIDTDPCCIINTSGSTGIPKSVVINHRSIIDFMDVAFEELFLDGNEIIGSLSPVYFDIYTLELYLMLAKKAKFVVIPSTYAMFPEQLVSFVEEKNINFLFWVPTVMVNIANLNILANYSLSAMKKILFAGEVFPIKHLLYWHHHLPTVTFVNMYGPIEITVDCLYHVLNQDDYESGVLPIGRPFKNTDILILNDNNELCSKGEMGELCVRGTSLAMGYYNDHDKTDKAFVQNPLNKAYPEIIYRTGDVVVKRDDGEILFVGRRDYQVKHLGYRIELGEIETIALQMPEINNACVAYNDEKKQIVLFYESDAGISSKEIRLWIGRKLPKYCLPNICRKLDKMPRNQNGKIDRNLLKNKLKNMEE